MLYCRGTSPSQAAKLAPLAEEIRGLGRRAHAVSADFLVDAEIDRMADEAWAAFGAIDIVVLNCQPDNENAGDLLTTPDAIWLQNQKSIAFGPRRMLQRLAPRMMERGGGSIVSIMSSTGLNPTPGFDAYGMAKNTLWLMTRYMAKEWGKGGIRANAFNPGTIATADNEERLRELAERRGILNRISLGRTGYTREVLGAAVYLASDESSFTSGQLINIDGGRF